MKAVCRTHIGLVRKSNQDSLIEYAASFSLYGVADGMGGHQAGDVASRLCAIMLGRVLDGAKPSIELLRAGIEEVNLLIYEEQLKDEALRGMGTTVTVLWDDGDGVLLGHVGDSRAYLLRAGKLAQITQDHSMVGEMVRAGLLTREAAESHPYRNVITRAVGVSPEVTVDVTRESKMPGDRWLICSDGLTEYVRDEEIEKALRTLAIEDAAETLLSAALDGGGGDNVSVVAVEVDG